MKKVDSLCSMQQQKTHSIFQYSVLKFSLSQHVIGLIISLWNAPLISSQYTDILRKVVQSVLVIIQVASLTVFVSLSVKTKLGKCL